MKVLSIIPARGGSKRFPRKNILLLNGKPLIAWTIEAGLKSKYINKLIVSSDDDEILSISQSHGAEIIKRPEEYASDKATSFSAVKHAIDTLDEKYDYIAMLQATSPLRDFSHINGAFEVLKEKRADAVISVTEVEHTPLWANTLPVDGNLNHFINPQIINMRSQDLPIYYRLNGAIYICNTKKLIQEGSFFIGDNIYAYCMDRKNSIDIDEEIDFIIAESIFRNIKKEI